MWISYLTLPNLTYVDINGHQYKFCLSISLSLDFIYRCLLMYNLELYGVFHQFTANLISLWWFEFELKPIFATDPVGFKNDAHYKSGQN